MLNHASRSYRAFTAQDVLGAAFKWALPRLGLYIAAAITGAVLFMGWAVFYTHIWPGAPERSAPTLPLNIRSEPTLESSPPKKQERVAPEDGPAMVWEPPNGGLTVMDASASASAATFVMRFIGAPVFGPKNQRIGKVNNVLFASDGAPKALIIGLQCSSCDQKDVAVPFHDVKWVYAKAAEESKANTGNKVPSELARAVISHSAADLQKAPAFQ